MSTISTGIRCTGIMMTVSGLPFFKSCAGGCQSCECSSRYCSYSRLAYSDGQLFAERGVQKTSFYERMKSVLTIHNLQFQGIFPPDVTHDLLGLEMDHFHYERLECNGFVNFMKAGIIAADHVTTVSPTYRNEIMTPYYGEQLEQVLQYREDDVTGILNGIDDTFYQPKSDPYIEAQYDSGILHASWKTKRSFGGGWGFQRKTIFR